MIFPKEVRHPFSSFVMIFESQLGVVDFKFSSVNDYHFFFNVRTMFRGAIPTAEEQGVRRALEFMRKNLHTMYCIKLFYMNDTSILNKRRNQTLLKQGVM